MYDNDYIIAVDENGQPYIAHAYATDGKGKNSAQGRRNAWGSLTGRATKYIDKIRTKTGRIRYIYPEMVNKAKAGVKKAWGSKAGRWIDSHDAGISEEILRRRAKRKSRQAFKRGDATTARQYAHRAAQLRDEAKGEREAAKNAVYGRTVGRAKDWLGYDEREERDKARQALNNGSYNDRTRAGKEHRLKETQAAYEKTLLGRYDKWNSARKVKKSTRK